MIVKLSLINPLWDKQQRRNLLDKVVQNSAAELEAKIKQKILDSRPAGKVYRRGAIFKKVAKRDLTFFRSNQAIFKRKFSDLFKEKTTVGYSFHRASKKGQPPAVDSGSLLNSIRSRSVGLGKAVVFTSKRYASILDDKNRLDRPFFQSTADEFKDKFKLSLQKAIAEIRK